MKANLMLKLALVAAALLLSACTSTGDRHAPFHAAKSGTAVDHERVALIDHVARRKGVQVVWINPPQVKED